MSEPLTYADILEFRVGEDGEPSVTLVSLLLLLDYLSGLEDAPPIGVATLQTLGAVVAETFLQK